MDKSSTRVITGSIVLWEIRHSMADWDCSKILVLLGILKIQNRPREEGYPMYLGESNVRSHKLDVQETNFSLTQFY